MKNILIASLALALFSCAVSAASASDLAVSKSTLGSMGLSGMQQMSDSDGMTVRGKGTFAGVWGGSTAQFTGGQHSNNNYEAAASWAGKSSAATGSSLSFAGIVEAQYAQDPTGSALSVQILGGISGGKAFATAW